MVAFFTRMSALNRFLLFFIILLLSFISSIALGTKPISLSTIYTSFVEYNGSEDHVIIQTARIPRAIIAVLIGACLGISGTIMQTITRNPLASPELLGMNHGAALGVVFSIFFLQSATMISHIWFALAGAMVTTIIVLVFSSIGHNGMTPLKITLAGATISGLLVSLTQGILILNERSLDELRFWLAGSVSGRDPNMLIKILPFMAIGFLCTFLLQKQIALLSLGDDVATNLGQNTTLVRGASVLLVTLLAGSSVALAGPIAFIGLAVPHLTRSLVGNQFHQILIYSGIIGATLLLLADVSARFVLYPEEISVGIMTAILGTPFFIYLVRKKGWK